MENTVHDQTCAWPDSLCHIIDDMVGIAGKQADEIIDDAGNDKHEKVEKKDIDYQ